MSTQKQNQPRQIHVATVQDDNRSLTNLGMELYENADLLKILPYSRATFQHQNELPGAYAERILYGDMKDEKDQLWIFFTLLGGGQNFNKETGGNRMITFQSLKGAQNDDAPVRANKFETVGLASAPFKFASDAQQVVVSNRLSPCGGKY